MPEPKITAAEALYGFVGWLTTRKEQTVMSATDDAAPIAELVKEFIEANGIEDPRGDVFPENIVHPT